MYINILYKLISRSNIKLIIYKNVTYYIPDIFDFCWWTGNIYTEHKVEDDNVKNSM